MEILSDSKPDLSVVTQSFSQKPGTDYSNDETFAPVMWFKTLWTLLALGAVNNQKIQQFDIKGAYLHGTLHKTIFMQQLEGFNDRSGHVCRLIRPLYGLKQFRNVWNKELTTTMTSLGFSQLKTDYCCFIQQKNNSFTIMIVWVDNILLFLNWMLEMIGLKQISNLNLKSTQSEIHQWF
jgi:hypothetical protein